jgi:hypothetical protein
MGTRYGSLVIRILDMLQFFPIVARQTCLLK